jgi:hypothetical protein
MAKIKRDYIVAIVAIVVVIVIVGLVLMYLNGSSRNSDRDSAQDVYDQKVVEVNNQIAAVNDFSARWQTTMALPQLKGFLDDYRSNLTTLASMVNDTNNAGVVLKGYLQSDSSGYSAVTRNEQMLKENLDMYVSDYNSHVQSYNDHIGAQYGNATLF